MNAEFLIARNPQELSKMPYLLRLPLDDGDLWLKATQKWPRDVRVYCHAFEGVPQLADLEVLERAPAVVCERRGRAIDLVLDRPSNRRSQFVFAAKDGRQLIFWQTEVSAKSARPGLRIPAQWTPRAITVSVDPRERYGYRFSGRTCLVEKAVLTAGDYAVLIDRKPIASVERKTAADFLRSVIDGSLNFRMAELGSLPNAIVVVEASYSGILRNAYARGSFIADMIARLLIRYPRVSINFVESRKLAEEFTYRYLLAAYAEATTLPLDLPG